MRIIIFLILLLIPLTGFAQRAVVRSGEHTGYTRLAIEFSDPVEWELGRIEDGYQIRLHWSGSEIDLSKIYHRISHNRIKNLSVSDDKTLITLGLGCDCHADAFEFRPGLLVVDIKDGKPPATSEFETSFYSGKLTDEQYRGVKEPVEILRNTNDRTEAQASITLPLMIPNRQIPTKLNSGILDENLKDMIDNPTQRVVEMQSEILHQIGRAASQGLLDANLSHPVGVAPIDTEAGEAIAPESPVLIVNSQMNIHIESSIDREFASLSRKYMMTENGSICLPESLFNVAEWGDEEAVLSKISEQRGNISGEFDKIDAQAVEGLVKAYIYAGFGAEALGVLSSFDVVLEEREALTIMAQIVDGITPDQYAGFSGQIGCETSSALWAALYVPTFSKQAQVNSASILSEFSGLPVHLRRLLGPNLAQRFLKHGNLETARSLRNSIARAPGESGSEFNLLEAQLDLKRGLYSSAEHALEEIIINDKEVAPRALIELLEVRLRKGEGIDPKILATAESYVFEQGDTIIAADLKGLIAQLLGQSGDFILALDALNELDAFVALDKQQKATIWEKVIVNLAMDAPESVLLRFVFSATDQLGSQNISRDIRRKLASRLLREGWPDLAEKVLVSPVNPTADDRIILAQAATLKGDEKQVLKLLENVAGDKAARLRALAYYSAGHYLSSAQEYRQLQDGENQIIAAWRAEDWAQLAVIGSKGDQVAAVMMLSDGQKPKESQPQISGMIEHDLSLLTKSAKDRQSIDLLLKEHPILMQ